jgi:hypothetical protein
MTIQIYASHIKETDVYKNASKVQQILLCNKSNVEQIKNGVNVSKNIGFDVWKKQANFTSTNEKIVSELLNKI